MPGLRTVILLSLSNVFMTFAYAHLEDLKERAWWIAGAVFFMFYFKPAA